jgi:CRISPR/Cas system-associated exonuclease Cas4 (RecB family)
MALETLHELVAQYRPWSVSKIDTLKQCPHKFWFNYVKKVKLERPVNKALLIGQAVHKVLQYAVTGRTLDACFEFAIIDCKLTSEEIEDVLSYRPAVTVFLAKYHQYVQKHGIRESITEKQYAIDITGKPVKFFDNDNAFIRGVVDLVMFVRTQPHIIVLDHKTGKHREFSHYDSQFDFYRLLLRAGHPSISGIVTGIHYASDASIKTSPLTDISDLEPLYNKVVGYMNYIASGITTLEEKKTGWWCRFCDYQDGCLNGEEGR